MFSLHHLLLILFIPSPFRFSFSICWMTLNSIWFEWYGKYGIPEWIWRRRRMRNPAGSQQTTYYKTFVVFPFKHISLSFGIFLLFFSASVSFYLYNSSFSLVFPWEIHMVICWRKANRMYCEVLQLKHTYDSATSVWSEGVDMILAIRLCTGCARCSLSVCINGCSLLCLIDIYVYTRLYYLNLYSFLSFLTMSKRSRSDEDLSAIWFCLLCLVLVLCWIVSCPLLCRSAHCRYFSEDCTFSCRHFWILFAFIWSKTKEWKGPRAEHNVMGKREDVTERSTAGAQYEKVLRDEWIMCKQKQYVFSLK